MLQLDTMEDTAKQKTKSKQLRVAAYIRVSTEDQAEKYGPEMQWEAINAYVKSKGRLEDGREVMVIDPKHVYHDHMSGTTELRARDGFAQLIEDIEQAPKDRKPFDVVAVYKVDRFARRLKILLQTIEFFDNHKIEFLSVNESIDTSTPFGKAILSIMVVIAELEIETTKMRTQGGRKAAFNKGIFQGTAPFGYTKDAEKRLIVLSSEAAVVKQMYDWFVFEGYSTQDIATKLTQENIFSPDASAVQHHKRKGDIHKIHGATFWRGEKVRDILNDRVYLGLQYGNKTKKNKDVPKDQWVLSDYRHEPIIEPSIFAKAQEKLVASASKAISRKENERQYLLRSLIKCGHCRKLETEMLTWHGFEKTKNNQTSYFYRCGGKTTAKHSVSCPTLPIPGEQIDEYIINFVKSLLDNPEATYKYQLNLQSTKVRTKNLQTERSRHRDSLNQIPSRKENLSIQHELGKLSDEQFDERTAKVEAEELQLTKRMTEIDQILGQQAMSEGYTKSFAVFAKKYRKALDEAFNNFDDKYTLVHALIDKIIIYSRPVNHDFDKVAGKKKAGQQMPNEIKIELKLPQQIIADLVERKFAPKTGGGSHGGDSNP